MGDAGDLGDFVWNGVSIFLDNYSINPTMLYLSYPPPPFHTQLFQKGDTVTDVGNEDLPSYPCKHGFSGRRGNTPQTPTKHKGGGVSYVWRYKMWGKSFEMVKCHLHANSL